MKYEWREFLCTASSTSVVIGIGRAPGPNMLGTGLGGIGQIRVGLVLLLVSPSGRIGEVVLALSRTLRPGT
jgi:hypothetical protein